jgi:uncharacterized protein YndB with AHSA1/START domain
MNAGNAETGKELVITRVLDAPRELVWKAHSEAGRLMQWWGPKGFRMKVARLDFRPGGVFHYGLQTPGGQEMWGRFVYREIVAPERMVFVVSFSDAEGGVTRHPGAANWPLEVLNTLTLAESGGKTTLTLRGGPINATEVERRIFADNFAGMQQGFSGTYDQLAEYLERA